MTLQRAARWLCALAAAGFSAAADAGEFSFDDCILGGMRGVASDAAARMVKEACENKRAKAVEQQMAQKHAALDASYGREVRAQELRSFPARISRGGTGGDTLLEVRNQSSETLTFARVSIGVELSGNCVPGQILFLKLRLAPGLVTSLQRSGGDAVAPNNLRLCAVVTYARAKPRGWSDAFPWISPSTAILLEDPFSHRPDSDAN